MNSPNANTLRLFQPEHCLLKELIHYLSGYGQLELAAATVLLPTMRLRVQLLAGLMRHRQRAFVPPRILTLTPFVDEILKGAKAPATDRPTLASKAADFELSLIAEQILTPTAGKSEFHHLRPSHRHELLLLYKEAQELDLIGSFRERREVAVAGENARSNQALAGFSQRLGEVEVFFKRFDADLSQALLESPQQRAKTQAGRAVQFLAAGGWQTQGPILLAGFTSIAPYYLPLIQRLMANHAAQIWLSAPPLGSAPLSPLASLIHALKSPPSAGSGAIQPSEATYTPELHTVHAPAFVHPRSGAAIACSSSEEEIGIALKLAEQAVQAGVPPHAIAIIVNGERSYTLPLLHETAGGQIPFNFALPLPFRLTPIGGWIEALSRFLVGGSLPVNLLDFVCHPFSLDLLMKEPSLTDLYQNESDLASHFCQALGRFPFLGSLHQLVATTDVVIVKEVLKWALGKRDALGPSTDTVGGQATSIKGKKSLRNWCDDLLRLSQEVTPTSLEQASQSSQPSLAFAAPARQFLAEFLATSAQSTLSAKTLFSAVEFCAFLGDHLLDQPIHRIGEPLAGVQIIQFSESRSVPFEMVVLLGCHEGDLPSRLPQDEVIDHFSKPTLGFRAQQYLESLQDLNVSLLFSRIPTVFLLHNGGATQSPNIPSRYVQLLVHSGFPQLSAKAFQSTGDHEMGSPSTLPLGSAEKSLEEPRVELAAGNETPWFLPTDSLSVSRLREFLHCPMRFRAHQLKLQPLELPGQQMTYQAEGELLHGVLEAFFSERCTRLPHLRQRQFPWGEAPLPDDRTGFCLGVVQRLEKISSQFLPASAAGHALLLQLTLRSWPAFAEFLWRLRQQDPELLTRGLQEWNFNCELTTIDLDDKRQTVMLRGSTDLILRFQTALIIIDYKRKNLPSQLDVTHSIDPQLLAYTMGSQVLEVQETVAGFWNILKGEWVPRLKSDCAVAAPALTEELSGKRSTYCSEATRSLTSLLQMRQRTMAEQPPSQSPFYADPTLCRGCDLAGVCRKDDPQNRLAISRQAHLRTWKAALKKSGKNGAHES